MRKIAKILIEIIREDRVFVALVAGLFFLSLIMFFMSFSMLKPGDAVVKIGYGDIGNIVGGERALSGAGYRDGVWTENFSFMVLALIFGLAHTVLAVVLFYKKREMMAKGFAMVSMGLVLVAMVVMMKLRL